MRHHLHFLTDEWRPAGEAWSLTPACDIEENEDQFLLSLDVPGVSRENIQIEVADGRLVVSAERKQEKNQDTDNRFFSERRYGKFQRVFELGEKFFQQSFAAQIFDAELL